jgi:hypothetical protein
MENRVLYRVQCSNGLSVHCPNFNLISQVEAMFNEVSDNTLKKLVQLRSKLYHQKDLTNADYEYMSFMGTVL